jgi:competence protein ComEA
MIVCAALLVVPVAIKNRAGRDILAPTVFPVLSSGGVSVKVSGDVLYPGIYNVPANSVAVAAINMAVPMRPRYQYRTDPDATRSLLNGSALLLAELPDGSLIVTVGHMTVPELIVMGIPLDISTMGEADFSRLPGIGPALARRIAEYRQNNGGILQVDDLAAVAGIGEKKFQKIRAYF